MQRVGIISLVAMLAVLIAVSIFAEPSAVAQTKGKTPLQVCEEKFANLKSAQKANVIRGCVNDITRAKGKK